MILKVIGWLSSLRAPAPRVFALMIDDDNSAELYLFDSEEERTEFLWEYAMNNSFWDDEFDVDAYSDAATRASAFKAHYNDDLADAMEQTGAGWKTDER